MAPDGRQATVVNGRDIWILDLERSVPMRFTSSSASAVSTAWSPDGNRIAFVSKRDAREEIQIAGLDGRAETVPSTDDAFKQVYEWTRDGRSIVFGGLSAEAGWDVWLLPVEGEGKPVLLLRSPAWEMGAKVSPDGRWLSYMSNETGQFEIYVQSFPQLGNKVRISVGGGTNARWADDGKELRYVSGGARVAVAVTSEETFRPGEQRRIYTIRDDFDTADSYPDGRRTLVGVVTGTRPAEIGLLLDWTALLGR